MKTHNTKFVLITYLSTEQNNFQMQEELCCPSDIFKYEELTDNSTEIKIFKIFK